MAKTVPGTAHGTEISVSRARPVQPPVLRAARAVATPSATAAAVAAAAIQNELTTGRQTSWRDSSSR